MRRLAPRLLVCACLLAGAVQARPFTIDDLLDRQRLGPVTLSPSGRWLVMQSTAPYQTIARYELAEFADRTISRLDVVETPNGRPRRLFPDDGYGYLAGPYSPSGEMMAVTRVRGKDQELGFVTLATGAATWTGLAPLDNLFGATVQWIDETTVAAIARDPDQLGFAPNYGWQLRERLKMQWARAASGQGSLAAVGSGRYLGVGASPPARRVVRIDVASGAHEPLLVADAFDLQLSPDHRRLAVLLAAEAMQPDPTPPAGQAEPFRRHRLAVIELTDGGAWWPLPRHEAALDLLSWSSDSQSLLVFAKADPADWGAAAYWRIEPGPRRARAIETPGLSSAVGANIHGMRIAHGQWIGQDPIIQASATGAGASGRRDWYRLAAAGPVRLTGQLPTGARLAAADDEGAVFTDGSSSWRVAPDGALMARLDGAPALNLGASGGERMIVNDKPPPARLLLGKTSAHDTVAITGLEATSPGPGVAIPKAETLLAASRPDLAVSRRTDARGVDTLLLRTPAGPPRVVLTLNGHLAAVDPALSRPILHPGPDGRPVTSWLYLPPHQAAGAPAALIVAAYPGHVGPSSAQGLSPPNGYEYPNPHLLAGAGYAVLVPSLPLDRRREPIEGQAEDILRAVEAVKASGAPVDTDKMALWGHSYGAYGVLAAATQSPRFKAVIAAAASPDLFAAYGRGALGHGVTGGSGWEVNNAMGWLETGQARMGAPPWKDPDKYLRNSPILRADRITAPVLIITADFDGDPIGGRAMFNSLYRQRKDALLLTYLAEGHQMAVSANLRDLYARALAFLADQLAPAPKGAGATAAP
ncbi:S9 family peptidase [Caulobacter sp. 602-2]|uniref:S9 family peptidase n=1 Tax=Caulobacter sp. 602-2 TaxID=2710887 RepID=A0A6G4QVA3_9CAUL|nr:prolyl oligopeptidase family serine peptidase [Caulobacter sp. 602-2]NGM49377.1 S9 family peptidase [Caulobacter sp. 602-2]